MQFIKSVQFADDTTFYHAHSNIHQLIDMMNGQLSVVDTWLYI